MTWRDLMIATREDAPRGYPPKKKLFHPDSPLMIDLNGELQHISAVEFRPDTVIFTTSKEA